MLHVLCFHLNVETQYHHQLRASNACGLDAKAESMALCLAELAALDYGMMPFAGATLAAASTALALVCCAGYDSRDASAAVARASSGNGGTASRGATASHQRDRGQAGGSGGPGGGGGRQRRREASGVLQQSAVESAESAAGPGCR